MTATATVVLGCFLLLSIGAVVFLMFKDWDSDTPGQQGYRDRKKR